MPDMLSLIVDERIVWSEIIVEKSEKYFSGFFIPCFISDMFRFFLLPEI